MQGRVSKRAIQITLAKRRRAIPYRAGTWVYTQIAVVLEWEVWLTTRLPLRHYRRIRYGGISELWAPQPLTSSNDVGGDESHAPERSLRR